jgi:hypothetical protein
VPWTCPPCVAASASPCRVVVSLRLGSRCPKPLTRLSRSPARPPRVVLLLLASAHATMAAAAPLPSGGAPPNHCCALSPSQPSASPPPRRRAPPQARSPGSWSPAAPPPPAAAAVPPGSRGQRATDGRRPRCEWPQVRLTAAQLPCRSSAAGESQAVFSPRRSPPSPLLCSVPRKGKRVCCVRRQ